MRINCARCDKVHDSTVTPFKYGIIPDSKKQAIGSILEKNVEDEFICKQCGAINTVQINWYAGKKDDEDYEEE